MTSVEDRPDSLRKMLMQGWTHARMARELGMGVSTLRRRLKDQGLTKPQRSHRDAIPWTMPDTPEGYKHTFGVYLRELSTAAQTGDALVSLYELNTALRWARELVAKRQDVSYSEVKGWEIIPAGNDSHVQAVLERAEARLGE